MLRGLLLVCWAWLPAAAMAQAAPPALVLSLLEVAGKQHTVLVLDEHSGTARIVDVSAALDAPEQHPLELVQSHGFEMIRAMPDSHPVVEVPSASLSLLPMLGEHHVATATNYAEHQAETSSDEVFLFPKLGPATRSPAVVATGPGVLLDYEVEICAVFDRDISRIEEFEASLKGFFLCSDFTDRAELLRNLDMFDLASGAGFTEAKSGPDRFAVGHRLAVPGDWRPFLDGITLELALNGETRQRATGADMLLKLDGIIAMALAEADARRWRWRDEPVALLDGAALRGGQVVLTGTPGGVLMQLPGPGFIAARSVTWLVTGAVMEKSLQAHLVDGFVAQQAGAFLQPGDEITLSADELGAVSVTVVEAP